MSYYEQIRLACIKVNPSILDLKMGCEVKCSEGDIVTIAIVLDRKGWFKTSTGLLLSDEVIAEILGRPITLQDVLMVLGGEVGILGDGQFLKRRKEDDVFLDEYVWSEWIPRVGTRNFPKYDLSKSPQDQSEETLKFICDNIK